MQFILCDEAFDYIIQLYSQQVRLLLMCRCVFDSMCVISSPAGFARLQMALCYISVTASLFVPLTPILLPQLRGVLVFFLAFALSYHC